MADTADLKSAVPFGRAGSTPATGTTSERLWRFIVLTSEAYSSARAVLPFPQRASVPFGDPEGAGPLCSDAFFKASSARSLAPPFPRATGVPRGDPGGGFFHRSEPFFLFPKGLASPLGTPGGTRESVSFRLDFGPAENYADAPRVSALARCILWVVMSVWRGFVRAFRERQHPS